MTPLPRPAIAERRMCSVLFVDLAGFTPISEVRDPEEIRELLTRYFDIARTIVARYGGEVEKFIGDAVMAVWGTPIAHEDDAERAVRAALDLVEAVGVLGADVRALGLAARAGIVTGEVAVTIGATGQGMVAGDVVNTAARVQAQAEVGTVLVDNITRRTTAAAIGYQDTGAHQLKGKSETVRLWRATRVIAAARGADRVHGLEASFLGREREMRRVKEALHDTMETRRARLVSVVGVAGVGKSRLRWELFKYVDGLAGHMFWHAGRCLPYGDGVAYWALAEMVRQRLGIAEDEAVDHVSAKLTAGLHRWVALEEDRAFISPRLSALLGVAEPGLSREELFAGWRLWFEQLAAHDPVLLVVEDLQWADSGLIDFLDHLLDWSSDKPIFVLTMARPGLLERRPAWGTGRGNATSVTLEPLPEPVMSALLAELVPGLPSEVGERIVDQADGVPLYAVEIVRSLIDRDLVQAVDGIYQLTGDVTDLDVPASLSSLLAARIDALSHEERTIVQGLAVLGGTFPRAAVNAITDQEVPVVESLLASLVRKEILLVRTDRLSPDRGQYGFAQSLLRQVSYDTLSRRDRKARHLSVAAHLRSTFSDDGAEMAEVIAQHYYDALRAVPEDEDADGIRAETVLAFTRAGQRATSIGAPHAAEHAYATAAELVVDEPERCKLLEQAGDAGVQAGRYAQSLERYEHVMAAHLGAGREREAARVTARVGLALSRLGRGEQAIPLLQQALDLLSDKEPDDTVVRLHHRLGAVLVFCGHREEAVPHAEAALQLSQALQLPDLLATAAEFKATLLSFADRPQEALAHYEWAIALAGGLSLTSIVVIAHNNAGNVSANADLPGAIEHCQAALDLSRRRGNRPYEAGAAGNLVRAWLFGGRWAEAEELCDELLMDRAGDKRVGAEQLHRWLACLHAWRGEISAAEQSLSRMSRWAESDNVQDRCGHAAVTACVALGAGDHIRALDSASAAYCQGIDAVGAANESVRLAWPVAVEAALALQRDGEAEQLLTRLGARPPGHIPPYLRAQLHRYRGRLAVVRGRADEAHEEFGAAEEELHRLGYPYFLAEARLDHAESLVRAARYEHAPLLVSQASETFERLGSIPSLERCRGLREALNLEPAV
ncbi:MAG: ATP-binding protein [Acidimicrobiales bacterium]